jgi:hypothetical protein
MTLFIYRICSSLLDLKRQNLLLLPFLRSPLGLQYDALQFLENQKVLIGVINLGVGLFFRNKEAYLFQALQLALDVAGIFFNELSQASDMRLEVRVFGIYHYNFSADS